MPPGDLARHAFIVAFIGAIAIFGLKIWNKSKAEKLVIVELQTFTSDASMFEQFNQRDAAATLLKTLHTIHIANKRFEIPPADAIDRAFKIADEGIMEATDSSRRRFNPRQILIRESLLRNFENATRLGFFDDSLSTDMLSRGEAPHIAEGPATGQIVEIGFLIDPSAFPGAEKIIPNLVLRPPTNKETPPDEFQIAQAKRLANLLQDASIIERETAGRIIKHYDDIIKATLTPAKETGETSAAPLEASP